MNLVKVEYIDQKRFFIFEDEKNGGFFIGEEGCDIMGKQFNSLPTLQEIKDMLHKE